MSRYYEKRDKEDSFNEVLAVDANDDEVYQKRSHRRHVQWSKITTFSYVSGSLIPSELRI